ncbi:MAG: O-antigen ligase family protein, partial [Actinomycetota bacterium]
GVGYDSTRTLDMWGLTLFLLALSWVWVSAQASGGDPLPTTRLLLVLAAYYIGGRVVGSMVPAAIPLLIAGAGLVLLVADPADVLSARPLDGPFGYSNATGAFYAQAAFAAAMLAMQLPLLRSLGVVIAAACAAVPFIVGSSAAGFLAAGFIPIAAFARTRSATKSIVQLAAALGLAALMVTAYLGVTDSPSDRGAGLDRIVNETFGGRRTALWNDALTMIGDQPIFGVGPDRFQEVSSVARSDRDARWAHNELLQLGAETGLPGMAAWLALFGWAFIRLASRPRGYVTALGALALSALLVHSSIDYILHFLSVAAAGAALVGSATAAPVRRARMAGLSERQGSP